MSYLGNLTFSSDMYPLESYLKDLIIPQIIFLVNYILDRPPYHNYICYIDMYLSKVMVKVRVRERV